MQTEQSQATCARVSRDDHDVRACRHLDVRLCGARFSAKAGGGTRCLCWLIACGADCCALDLFGLCSHGEDAGDEPKRASRLAMRRPSFGLLSGSHRRQQRAGLALDLSCCCILLRLLPCLDSQIRPCCELYLTRRRSAGELRVRRILGLTLPCGRPSSGRHRGEFGGR